MTVSEPILRRYNTFKSLTNLSQSACAVLFPLKANNIPHLLAELDADQQYTVLPIAVGCGVILLFDLRHRTAVTFCAVYALELKDIHPFLPIRQRQTYGHVHPSFVAAFLHSNVETQ